MDCGRLDDSNFSWPSLYNPAFEVGFVGLAYRPGVRYLSDADADVFKYTLYWTLILYLPFNFFAGVYAFLNFVVPPRARKVGEEGGEEGDEGDGDGEEEEIVRLTAMQPSVDADAVPGPSTTYPPPTCSPSSNQNRNMESKDKKPTLRRTNIRRSRYTFSLLVLLSFLIYGMLSSVLGAAVLSWLIVGVYRAGGFCVSTWIPFVWAVIQSLIALLEIWPSIIDIV